MPQTTGESADSVLDKGKDGKRSEIAHGEGVTPMAAEAINNVGGRGAIPQQPNGNKVRLTRL